MLGDAPASYGGATAPAVVRGSAFLAETPAPYQATPAPRETPPPVAMPAPAAPMAAATGPLVVDDWMRLIDQAGLKGPVGQLAQHSALLGVEGHTLKLALKPEHDHLNSAPMVSMLEDRIGAALGRAIRVTFEKTRAGLQTPADLAARVRSEQQQEAERALDADPFVQAVVRDLGGRIVPNSVRPPDA